MPGAQRCVGSGDSPCWSGKGGNSHKEGAPSPEVMQGGEGGVPEVSSLLTMWVLDSSPPRRSGSVPMCCADPYLSLKLALFGLSLCVLTAGQP